MYMRACVFTDVTECPGWILWKTALISTDGHQMTSGAHNQYFGIALILTDGRELTGKT